MDEPKTLLPVSSKAVALSIRAHILGRVDFFPIEAAHKKTTPDLRSPDLSLMLWKLSTATGCLQVNI